jgi:hypothetical protein
LKLYFNDPKAMKHVGNLIRANKHLLDHFGEDKEWYNNNNNNSDDNVNKDKYNKTIIPHELHIHPHVQFMVDYNLTGLICMYSFDLINFI